MRIDANNVNISLEDLRWLDGRTVLDVRFAAPDSWWFDFTDGAYVASDGGPWRLLSAGRVIACSPDHGHPFGQGGPSDQLSLARLAIQNRVVRGVEVGPVAPDLIISIDGGMRLEFLAISMGYECWQVRDPNGRTLVVRGSREASAF
jgi:hypothetical protein